MGISRSYDLSFLNKISGGDESFIRDMISTFRTMAGDYIEKSGEFHNGNQIEALSKETHRFIPGVSFLGAKKLEEDLLKIEEYTKKSVNLDQIGELLNSVRNSIEVLLDEFEDDFKG